MRLLFVLLLVSGLAAAHQNKQHSATATYVGNEGVLVRTDKVKVLFDPFFHRDFGIYQLVPKALSDAIMSGEPPYDDIDAVFVSHAHDDHFDPNRMLTYMRKHPKIRLVAPAQAIDKFKALPGSEAVLDRAVSVSLDFSDAPWQMALGDILVDAVRIPHAGWPGRAEVENLVFRVGLNDSVVVMHMGDADPNVHHYLPYRAHWQKRRTDTAFAPYWFYFSMEGQDILDEYINAEHHIGVHVPVVLPKMLKKTSRDYFHRPSEERELHTHTGDP